MLILVGTVPMAYALNRAMPADQAVQFAAIAQVTQISLQNIAPGAAPDQPLDTLSTYIRTKEATPELLPALAAVTGSIGNQVKEYGSLRKVPADADTKANLTAFKAEIDKATKFIPLWVKVAVAIALGLGTMVGWKRIVVTVGERIGKTHLTYAQGASAETVAMLTIGAADLYGLPVSTTQVLSSGVAGTMAANRSGLQMATVRNLLMAWVLTLPMAMLLAGSLYWLFSQFI